MILIKLGGSVLTNKDRPYSFKRKTLERLTDEIVRSDLDDLILVHGGGSFGHPGAEKYKLNSKNPIDIEEGTAKVQKDMRIMNNHVLEIMHEKGLWTVSLPGGLVTKYKDGKLVDFNEEIFERYLSIGTVPISFGDVAFDEDREVTICSGDDIMLSLAEKADKAIFVANVDGVFKNGRLVETFTKEMFPLRPEDFDSEETSIDVTGGMNKKVKKMLEMSKHCPTYVVNGSKKERLYKLLNNESTPCTEVKYD